MGQVELPAIVQFGLLKKLPNALEYQQLLI
jgi:hypothetical protein